MLMSLLHLAPAGHGALPPLAFLLPALFALAAWRLRAVTGAGAAAGGAVACLLYLAAGGAGFATLVAVFALAVGSTRLGHARKLALGTAESGRGRSGRQIAANLGVAGGCSVMALATGDPRWLGAAVAALAEAAGDTVSSELGQATRARVYLITSGRPVPAGTDGGVSLPGTLAGAGAVLLVNLVAAALAVVPWEWMAALSAAAFLGVMADSLLGALLERRGRLGNDAVNLLGTLAAALLFLSFVW
jgi:uncharacterized protein (TIGR00297 family)